MHCMQTCQDCECFLKSKSLSDMWLPDPYSMQGFFYEKEEVFFWSLNFFWEKAKTLSGLGGNCQPLHFTD